MRKLLLIIIFVIASLDVKAETIFSDDFEWGSDWNSSQGDTAPVANGWSTIACTNRGGSYEAAYVNSAGAKQGSRGFIQYWDKTESQGSAQDIYFRIASITLPDEYRIGYWYKVDPTWGWGSVASLKIIKTAFADGTTWDINWVTQGTMIAYCTGDYDGIDDWCVVNGTRWTGEANVGATIMTDEAAYKVFGNWSEIDDGNWHYFVWHMKHSTNTLELSVDGSDAFQMGAEGWPPSSPFSNGVSGQLTFGGNITDGGGANAEQWTAYDDFIIATTEAEVLSFLGVGETPAVTSKYTITGGTCTGCQ